LLKTFLLPPALQLLLMGFALVLWRKSKKIAYALILFSWVSLLALSLPAVSGWLFEWLEAPYIEQAEPSLVDVGAIVILGGGRKRNLPEYDEDQVSYHSLWRLRYGARLAKQLGLPIIVSGGTVYPYETISEAAISANLLSEDYGIETVWQEGDSRDTWHNAIYTAKLAKEKGISQVILVTHAYHMRRAQMAFEQAGLDVVPMATGFFSVSGDQWINHWLPKGAALYRSQVALHEYLGLLYYRLR
jgi:uncharacterized SAM-binding protein YcdF (DUF218 family)